MLNLSHQGLFRRSAKELHRSFDPVGCHGLGRSDSAVALESSIKVVATAMTGPPGMMGFEKLPQTPGKIGPGHSNFPKDSDHRLPEPQVATKGGWHIRNAFFIFKTVAGEGIPGAFQRT